MGVIITGRIADSAGMYEAGRIEFSQAQRVDTGELLVTQSVAVAQVVQGELRTLTGAVFSLPVNPAGTAVRVREVLGGRTFEWWTAVPDVASIEYRELPIIESAGVPESVWGPPPWIAQVEQMRDETIQAVADGTAVAEALGGLAGITQAVTDAETARDGAAASAGQAASSAGVAHAEADRAEAAAASIDMAAINQRLDGMDTSIGSKVNRTSSTLRLYGTTAGGAQTVLSYGQTALAGSIPQRGTDGRLPGIGAPTVDTDAATKRYVDEQVASVAPSGRVDRVAALRTPVIIAHRGAMGCYPEHSWEGYRASFEAGFSPEADVRALADGTLVCIHDATTDRTMTVSKSVASMTVAEWRGARIKPPVLGGRISGTGHGSPVFFEDYLDEFGGRCVLWPEIKITGSAVTRIIEAVKSRGLERSVILQSNSLSVCQQVVAAGLNALLLTNTLAASTITGAGIAFVGVSAAATDTYVASLKTAGLKVLAWTMNTKAAADAQLARGADGIFSDDPWEVSREYAPRTSLDLSRGFVPPASSFSAAPSHAPPGTDTQKITVAGNALHFQNAETAARLAAIRIGEFGFGLSRAIVRLTAQAISPGPVPNPENTWLFGVYLGRQTGDAAVNEELNDSEWRLAMVRRNGQKNAYEKRTMTGSTASIGSTAVPSTPYAKAGGRSAPMEFEVEFTPTAVTIRNLTLNDTDLVASATSLEIPGAYITLAVNGGNGRVSDVSIETW